MKKIFYFVSRLFIVCIIIQVFYGIILKNKLTNSNEEFLKLLLNDSNYHRKYLIEYNNIFNKSLRYINNIDIKKPVSILENKFYYQNNITLPVMYSTNDEDKILNIETSSKYIKDPNNNMVENPSVYIYNTHQLESYNKKSYTDYDITPNVMMASYILRENLNNKNIGTIVETENITDFLNANGWDYSNSYNASRYYVKDAIKRYSNLKLIIDLHRDAIKKKASTITINNKSYAKVLFVVGLEHKNYKENLETANKLNEIINKKYPKLSRGILKKEGKNVNGIYNQDLNSKIVLIEVGGIENTIGEVMNTSIALSDVIKEYVEG